MRVEVVADQGGALRLRKVYVHQVLQDLGASQFRAARRHLHVRLPAKGAVIRNRWAVPARRYA